MSRVTLRVLVVAAALLGSVSIGRADTLPLFFEQSLNETSFYLVDDPSSNDHQVTLTLTGNMSMYRIQIRYGSRDWDFITATNRRVGSVAVQTGQDDWERVYFRVVSADPGSPYYPNLNDPSYSYAGDLLFAGLDQSGAGRLWNSVEVDWAGSYITAIANDNDDVSPVLGSIQNDLPPVPVPQTFLLLGTGLVGFIFFRRKKGATSEKSRSRTFS